MGLENAERVRFGAYELDPLARTLLRDGAPVKIQPQPLRVLQVLLERPGEIHAREELRARIWGDATFVEFDQGLNYCIRQIRLALGDDASEPVYIETLPKQGYRFIAPVVTAPVVRNSSNGRTAPAMVEDRAAEKRRNWRYAIGAICLLFVAGAGLLYTAGFRHPARLPAAYAQITSFTDSAVDPVLSPDGRMVAFYRSDHRFLTSDQIYLKMLPDGEPRQLTHDPRRKYNLAFSPDGTRIAYTVFDNGFATYTVPVLGGDPQLLFPNTAGLTWLDEHQLLFSEIKSGVHMGIVSAKDDRSGRREIYFPEHERGMAHYSYPSPDHKWALAVEMDPEWKPCRLVPLAGGSSGRSVGPAGACTSAAWSPDGAWMYFAVEAEGRRHLWRQRFPAGAPEQITDGSTDEDGLAIARDGRSLITSISTSQDAVWLHDSQGDRALSSEGYAGLALPKWSSGGKRVYFLLRHDSPESPSELWRADLDTRRTEVIVPGRSMREFDISPDEKEVLFTTHEGGQPAQLWLAPLDRAEPPRRIAAHGDAAPHFGPGGEILFRMTEGNAYYIGRMKRDGSGREKVFPFPVLDVFGISPDRKYLLLGLSAAGPGAPGKGAVSAVPLDGGPSRHVCDDVCSAAWSADGRYFYLEIESPSQEYPAGRMLAIPVRPGQTLPALPASGVRSAHDVTIAGTRIVDHDNLAPGVGSTYAYLKRTTHANLFRISLER